MNTPTSTHPAEIQMLTDAYAALNRNDIPAMVNMFDPQIAWTEPPEYPTGGTYRGHAELRAHLAKARGTWAEGSCAPERFIVSGDRIVVFLRVHVRLRDHTDWIDGEIADVYTFRDGKAVDMRHFPHRDQALEWAGITSSDAR